MEAPVTVLLQQANDYFIHNDLDLASFKLRGAIMLVPDAPELLIAYGNLLLRSGQTEAGHREFAKAVVIAPGNIAGHLNLAGAAIMLGNLAEARASYQCAQAIDPHHPDLAQLSAILSAASAGPAR